MGKLCPEAPVLLLFFLDPPPLLPEKSMGRVAPEVERLGGKCEALRANPSTAKGKRERAPLHSSPTHCHLLWLMSTAKGKPQVFLYNVRASFDKFQIFN
jgi:hypothetical protein